MNHVTGTAVKFVNFMRARVLNHRQLIFLLQDLDFKHTDALYHSSVCWLGLDKVLSRVWDFKKFCVLGYER